jgi:hypothetical protein
MAPGYAPPAAGISEKVDTSDPARDRGIEACDQAPPTPDLEIQRRPLMYHLVIRQFALTLRNLDAIMAKAETHAQTRKFDVNNFCAMRLSPDMLPFLSQVRIACDHAKNAAANVAGKTAPVFEDNEVTFADLRARIAKCLAYLDTITEQDFVNTTAAQVVKLPRPAGTGLRVNDYLFSRQVPNFFFHVTTAYGLLRHGGVDLGKSDFLGALNIIDA